MSNATESQLWIARVAIIATGAFAGRGMMARASVEQVALAQCKLFESAAAFEAVVAWALSKTPGDTTGIDKLVDTLMLIQASVPALQEPS